MAKLEQWVNIARDPKWVEDDVGSVERLGPAHLECKFKKALPASFHFKVEPVGTPAAYTDAEKTRNSVFTLRNARGAYGNDGKKTVKLAQDVLLPAAGADEFKVKAKYKDKEVEASKTIVTRRRLFYQSCAMQGIAPGNVASMETAYWAADDFYIKLVNKAAGTMPLMKTLYRDDGSGADNYLAFIRAGKAAWRLQARMPYAFMLVWVNYIAAMGEKQITKMVDLDLPSKLWTWSWKGQSFEFNVGAFLWHGLDDTHDAAKHWLVSVDVRFRDKKGNVTRLPIPDDRVSLAGDPRFTYGGYHKVRVDLSADDLAGIRNRFTRRQGKVRFRLKLRVAAGWTNGFSFNGVNMITVADKACWADQSAAVKEYTLNHEFGHKIGMVADGTGRGPDGPATLYGNVPAGPGANSKGHQGPHCEQGAAYDAGTKRWSGAPGCVMFGADAAFDGNTRNAAPPTYCAACKPIVRKLDLSAGMPGFQKTPNDF